jgi:hypothetical protein
MTESTNDQIHSQAHPDPHSHSDPHSDPHPHPQLPMALLARFADAIERTGIESVPASLLTELADAARDANVSPVVLAVLVDPTEPTVARERAFMKAAIRIIGADRPPATPSLGSAAPVGIDDRRPALVAC